MRYRRMFCHKLGSKRRFGFFRGERGLRAKVTTLTSLKSPQDLIGFGKRGLLEKASFQSDRKVHFLEIPENLEIIEILENPQAVANKVESDHFLEILENLEILEILEIPPVKRPLS